MPDISNSDFADLHASGVQLVDVREDDEYAGGHVLGAASIPMGQLPDRLGELDRSRPVYVICQAGGRSAAMTDLLTSRGFEAYSVAGGTGGWIAAGRPVDRDGR